MDAFCESARRRHLSAQLKADQMARDAKSGAVAATQSSDVKIDIASDIKSSPSSSTDEKALVAARSKRTKAFWVHRQWVSLRHPLRDDRSGDIELEIELLPSTVASMDPEYRAGDGTDSWDPALNDSLHLLPKHQRPASSFPWYRLDLQLLWRIRYAWDKIKW